MPDHTCTCSKNPLVPQLCRVIRITEETPDVKTFRIQTQDGNKPFAPKPGQLGMLSLPGIGEAMFSITAQGENYIDCAIKRVGEFTEGIHEITEGDLLGVRGPYGNCFPAEEYKGHNILFIGGGIGLAPIRSLLLHCLEHRRDYGHIDVVYGSRSPDDLVFKEDLFTNWPAQPDTAVYLTIDRPAEGWTGKVGFVPAYLEELGFAPHNTKVALCGPPIMIKLCSDSLLKMGFDKRDVITTLEMRMKCGIGKCGRCNLGSKFICLDGPVFSLAELDELPDEN